MNRIELLPHFNVLLPVSGSALAQQLLPWALTLVSDSAESQIQLVGITPMETGTSLSEGTLAARQLRTELEEVARDYASVNRLASSVVSYQPWEDTQALLAEQRDEDHLLLLPWQADMKYLKFDLAELLSHPPCDVAVAHAAVPPTKIKRILLPVRGGPSARLAVQIAVRMARSVGAEITLLRVLSSKDDPQSHVLHANFSDLSEFFPEITTDLQIVGDVTECILRESQGHQVIVLGASGAHIGPAVSDAATELLKRGDISTVITRSKRQFHLPDAPALQPAVPVSVRVDKWFAENTFHSGEFADISRLIDLKNKQGLRLSVGLPALNEEESIGNVIRSIKTALMEDAPLLDEIVVIDSNSTDRTREIARECGVRCVIHQKVFGGTVSLRGKGEALWKSLHVLSGDLIAWMDTDVVNPDPRFVYGTLGPLLVNARIQYVKGFYERPNRDATKPSYSSGGRVTELVARPMINLFFPELSGVVQPLAGVYAGRRAALERLPFYVGYGVEIGHLLDLLPRFGLGAIAQVDLGELLHRNQDLRALGKMSFALLQVFAQHLRDRGQIDDSIAMERTMKSLCVKDERFYLEEVDIREIKRPPIVEIEEYKRRNIKEPS